MDNASEYIPSQKFTSTRITSEIFLHADLVQTLQHLTFLLFQVILHYDLQDNARNLYLLIHILQNLFLNHSLHLSLIQLHYSHQTFKLHFFQVLITTPVPPHIRLPEFYTADHSRPPTTNFADYPIKVDGTTIYDPKNDPRFPVLTERFITNTNLLSNKNETELKRLQTSNLELKFEVKVKFQGLNSHPVFHVSKMEHKTTPAPFEVTHLNLKEILNFQI